MLICTGYSTVLITFQQRTGGTVEVGHGLAVFQKVLYRFRIK